MDKRNLGQLKAVINDCGKLLQGNLNVYYRCVYIVEHIDEPWSHPTLKSILNDGKDASKTVSEEQLYKGRFLYYTIKYLSIQ